MPKFPLGDITSLGLITDIDPRSLRMGAWTEVRNVRFYNGRMEKFKGHKQVYGTLLHAPYSLLYVTNQVSQAWIYMGMEEVGAYIDGAHADITPNEFTFSTSSIPWNSFLFFNLPILNNGIDLPHMWADVDALQLLEPLTNWPATLRARVIRPYKNYLLALNVTESGTNYPHSLIWSNPAGPGDVPDSWDYTDPTNDAGRTSVADGVGGTIVDGLILGDSFIVYKERSVWEFPFTGRLPFLFEPTMLFPGEGGLGLLNANCACLIRNGTYHFAAGGESLYVHNGRDIDRISEARIEDYLYKDIDPTNYFRAFTVANPAYQEVWFCYPEAGATWPNKALVWNWQGGQFTYRDLAPAGSIAPGVILAENTDQAYWDAADMVNDWEDWDGFWYEIFHQPSERKLVQADPINSKLYWIDEGNLFDEDGISAWAVRLNIPLTEETTGGALRNAEKGDRFILTEIWPLASGRLGISFGSAQKVEGAVTWSAVKTIDCALENKKGFYVNGVELSLRIDFLDEDSDLLAAQVKVERTGISI